MKTERKQYYFDMMAKGRLMPIVIEDRFLGFITFYITNDESVYADADPWDVLEDNSEGHICYIAQLLTDKNSKNPSIFFSKWCSFKEHIKRNFPSVDTVCWRRFNKKKEVVRIYKKEL